jgi:hypothetical protein
MAEESAIMTRGSCVQNTKYCSNNKVKRLEWAGHLAGISDGRTAKKAFLCKPME